MNIPCQAPSAARQCTAPHIDAHATNLEAVVRCSQLRWGSASRQLLGRHRPDPTCHRMECQAAAAGSTATFVAVKTPMLPDIGHDPSALAPGAPMSARGGVVGAGRLCTRRQLQGQVPPPMRPGLFAHPFGRHTPGMAGAECLGSGDWASFQTGGMETRHRRRARLETFRLFLRRRLRPRGAALDALEPNEMLSPAKHRAAMHLYSIRV
jgi:hypothetical protein